MSRTKLGPWRSLSGAALAAGGLAACTYWAMLGQADGEEEVQPEAKAPLVEILPLEVQAFRPRIQAFGTVQPRFQTRLVAETSGVVEEIATPILQGLPVEEGEVLIRVDSLRQEAEVVAADAAVRQVRLQLAEERLLAEQAEGDWRLAGSEEPAPDFLLRRPHLEAAQGNLEDAMAAAAEARMEVERATIRAPYRAIVTERLISPGAFVTPGTALLDIQGLEQFEIQVPLDPQAWANLPEIEAMLQDAWPAGITSDGSAWTGMVVRADPQVDARTRHRDLILGVRDPLLEAPGLLPGMLVEVEILGRLVDRVLRIPEGAVSPMGEVWHVQDGRLARFEAKVLGADRDHLLVEAPPAMERAQVVVVPLLSYLPDMVVEAFQVEPQDD